MTLSNHATTIFTSTATRAGAKVPANRILENFRVTLGGDKEATLFFANMELRVIRKGDRGFFTENEQKHAERVLTRLIAFVE